MSNALLGLIRECVQNIGDPLMNHIQDHVCPHGWTKDDVRREVLRMVKRGELRMKEDSVDHDWSYRKGPNW